LRACREAGTWDERVTELWRTAAERSDEELLATVTALAAERPAGDAASAFERASALDHVGREQDAEALYRHALAAGLDDHHRQRAVIQLASTVRNLGRPEEAVRCFTRKSIDAARTG
jgi:tetratricopeptide (TPR) repeat protein